MTLLSYVATAVISASEAMHYAHNLWRALGPALRIWMSIDAVLVLSGAVLTSYVGVTGLARRMTLDRCLPQIILSQNKMAGHQPLDHHLLTAAQKRRNRTRSGQNLAPAQGIL